MEVANVVEILGGTRIIGGKVSNTSDFIPLIRIGFSFRSIEKLTHRLGLKIEQVAQFVNINPRTIHRRRSSETRLTAAESEKVYRLARVMALAEEVFEDRQNAQSWLLGNIPALGGVTPLSLMDTDEGARQVEETLLRLAWGVYS